MKAIALTVIATAAFLAGCALEPLDPCNKTPSNPPSLWRRVDDGLPHRIGGVVSVAIIGPTSTTCVTNGVQIMDDLNGSFRCDLFANGYGPCEPFGSTEPVCVGVLQPADGSGVIDGVCVYF